MPLTDIKLEQLLNESLAVLTYDEVIDNYSYLTEKSRRKHCSRKALEIAFVAGKLGSLLKKYDSIAFYSSRSDF